MLSPPCNKMFWSKFKSRAMKNWCASLKTSYVCDDLGAVSQTLRRNDFGHRESWSVTSVCFSLAPMMHWKSIISICFEKGLIL